MLCKGQVPKACFYNLMSEESHLACPHILASAGIGAVQASVQVTLATAVEVSAQVDEDVSVPDAGQGRPAQTS